MSIWEWKKLGDVAEIARGGSPRPIKEFITTDNDGVNWIKIGDTDPTGKYIFETEEKIKPSGIKKSRYVEKGDFLLSNSMSFGRPYILMTDGCIHDGWLVLRKYQDYLDIDFFYHLLTSPFVQNQFDREARGSTVRNLNTDIVSKIEVPIPPLSEQKRIVKTLDEKFAKIDKLKTAAETSLKNAKEIFNAELEKIFHGDNTWKMVRLGNCGTFKNGMNFTASDSGYKIRSLGVGDFKNLYQINDMETLSEISLNAPPSEDYFLKDGDIVFVRSNGNKELVGRCVLVYPRNTQTTYSGFCIRFRKDFDELNSDFLLHFLKSDQSRKILNGKEGANISNLNQKILGDFEVPLPPLSEQKRIVAHLDKLSEKVKRLEENYARTIADCEELKKSILKQVFEVEK